MSTNKMVDQGTSGARELSVEELELVVGGKAWVEVAASPTPGVLPGTASRYSTMSNAVLGHLLGVHITSAPAADPVIGHLLGVHTTSTHAHAPAHAQTSASSLGSIHTAGYGL